MKLKKTNPYLSTFAAAQDMGITVSQFTRLTAKLGIEHDDAYVNPHYRSGPPAKLWSKRKVAALKRRKAVQEFIAGAGARSAIARTATATKAARLDEECEAWVPTFRIIGPEGKPRSYESVIAAAIDSYNAFGDGIAMERGREPRDHATRSSSPEFLLRIARNYIRHELTDYEKRLAAIRGRVGTHDAYEAILRPIVESAIDIEYPELASYLGVPSGGDAICAAGAA